MHPLCLNEIISNCTKSSIWFKIQPLQKSQEIITAWDLNAPRTQAVVWRVLEETAEEQNYFAVSTVSQVSFGFKKNKIDE